MAEHICPWWLGYALANPLRKLINNPNSILKPFVAEGMRVLEVGPGMGFFSVPIARLVGPRGRLYCVDVQQKMIDGLKRRLEKKGVLDRVEARVCPGDSLAIDDLRQSIDVVLAIAVIHEIPRANQSIAEMAGALRSGGKMVISEPAGHVTPAGFAGTTALARNCGLLVIANPVIRGTLSVVLQKP